ncbi:hypothetical protein [Dawidia soli]|uniref:Uncharacterized protein n=1 Tax=Dawidia soli TaxID=2782352 RepID=A0AAP2GE70_9BACT|nr:hypothetical protein [Dawidia soli]MBT1688042.1 hypothetical protein [Dawidia soli]
MDTVRYTTLLKDYFRIATSLAEWVTTEDEHKTQEQLNNQIDLLISHLEAMKFVNALTHEARPLALFTITAPRLN